MSSPDLTIKNPLDLNRDPVVSVPPPQNFASAEEARIHLALDSAQMGTWDWDVAANTMEWDEQMHAVFGLKPRAFSGQYADFLAMIDPADRDGVEREMTSSLSDAAGFDGEFRVRWPGDGSVHTVRARAKVHSGGATSTMHMTGVSWDTTERRATDKALQTKRSLFAALMDNIPDLIYFKDLDSRFTAVNRAMANWFRREPAEMIGKSDLDLFTAEHAERALNDEREIISTGKPIVNLEEKETWPNGDVTWVSTTKMPLRDPRNGGRVIGTFGLSRDITEKKRAQVQLAHLAEELKEKNAALEEDLATARELQAALLPQRFPRFPRYAPPGKGLIQFYQFYRPSAAVSGDFFDVFDVADDVAGLFICDVMGHGVRAALVAAIVRTLVGELRDTWHDPARFLAELNKSLRTALRHARIPLFVSASYVVADLKRRELRSANAGHHCPVLIQRPSKLNPARGAKSLNGGKPGPALGIFDHAKFENASRALSEHDTVLLFTDGLFEVDGTDGALYDYDRLLEAVGRRSNLQPHELCQALVEEVQSFSGKEEFSDDMCLVAMEIG
jgi:sigma-B regulation protein RsbU (phosphoserine phosphatase)